MKDQQLLRLCTIPESEDSGPPAVICVALWRMGTASLAAALNDLGMRPHHALDLMDAPEQWADLERAAEATWPAVTPAGHTPRKPFTREDWDTIFGKYGAVTEIGAAFSEQLIETYPEAKVLIVRRDFEKWWPSFKSGVLDSCYDLRSNIMIRTVLPIVGTRVLHTMRKTLMGFFGVSAPAEITEEKAREVYDRHFDRVRELVPEDRRLEYTLGQGWGPLCEFLGKEVPNSEFPFINETDALRIRQSQETEKFARQALSKITSWLPGFSR